jgi:arsenate reductase-like glutaredoxin family protein
MKKIDVVIKGIAPLLQNRFPIEDYGINKSRAKRKVYVPEEEAKKSLYQNEDIGIYEPSEHLLASLIKSATKFIFEGKKTYKDIISTSILVEPECIPLITSKPYIIDKRPVVIGRARIVRSRPRFEDWQLEFTITILDEQNISPNTLKEILEMAGNSGIGDYRPRFGRFQVTQFKEE